MQTTIDDIIRIADDLHLESASQDLAYLKNAPNAGILSKPPMSNIWLRLLILPCHRNTRMADVYKHGKFVCLGN